MGVSVQSQARTRLFARVIGPFLIILTVTALFRAPQVWERASEYRADPLWLWSTGAFTLLAGLIVLALHPYWRGAAAVCVSLTGWITTLKGLALVVFPDGGMSAANVAMRAEGWTRAAYVLFALIGLYLTYVGWTPSRDREPSSQYVGP
ncbi:hypothetical protein K3U94_03395 [Mycolicibacter heraklionensis]|uniref:Uncharacterized protein n=1 Tax=Mycolicibacter heraklionensis TaxID=512402 RepID=A0A9X7WHM4_9MYCO|nr:hypothetical protein [Mycolicibacter heraklionensis]QZA08378.1 hypothetical protein K3U94_03395 [Mycolicibacter heraklionensis]